MTSSMESVEMSRNVSMEITRCLYLMQAMRRYFSTTFFESSGSPRVDS